MDNETPPDDVVTTPTPSGRAAWRDRWQHIIFNHDSGEAKQFDVWLLVAILASLLIVMLESVESIRESHGYALWWAEIFFTLLFTAEYIARLAVAKDPWRYARSFYGIVDLLSILPTYIMLLAPATVSVNRLTTVRSLRLLRAFRIFKLRSMLTEADALQQAIMQSRSKVAVFVSAVLVAVVIAGSAMHLIEGPENEGFDSIPESMYWAIVTMSTVGYGDISPITPAGKAVTVALILIGYSLIVVPTGIVTAELANTEGPSKRPRVCDRCDHIGHDLDANYCKRCGERLPKLAGRGTPATRTP